MRLPSLASALVLGLLVSGCVAQGYRDLGEGTDLGPTASDGIELVEVTDASADQLAASAEDLAEFGVNRRVFHFANDVTFGNCTLSKESTIILNATGRVRFVFKVKSQCKNKNIHTILRAWHVNGQFLFYSPHQTPGWTTRWGARTGPKNAWYTWTKDFVYAPELFLAIARFDVTLWCG